MKYTPKCLKSNVNISPTHPLKEFAVLVGGLLGIVIGIYLLLGLAVDLIAPKISINLEEKLAKPFIQKYVNKSDTSEKETYLQGLVDDLQTRCTHLPYDFKVHLVDSELVNAAALPGGHILVFQGLLDEVTSLNSLTYILAHELGHYANRDHLRGMGRALVLLTVSVALFGSDNAASDLLSKGLNITELSFSRKQEIQADEYGLDALQCIFGHAGGATAFFEKMSVDHDPGKWGHYFATHPENRRRIAHIEKQIEKMKYAIDKVSVMPKTLLE